MAYRGDLEADLSALPKACKVQLKVLRRLAQGATLDGMAQADETEERVTFEATAGRVAALRGMQLRASDHSHATLSIHFPAGLPDGAYQVSVLQKVGGKEMGRVTQRLVVGAFPYVGNADSHEVHLASCEWVQKMSPRHRLAFRDVNAAIRRGYNGCRFCLPQLDRG